MALEPGPAAWFDLKAIDLSPEAPLSPSDFQIEIPDMDSIGAGIDDDLPPMIQAVADLTQETFALYFDDSIFITDFPFAADTPPSPATLAIVDGVSLADQAIEDAASAIPVIQDPPTPPTTSTGTGTLGSGSGQHGTGDLPN